MVVFCESCGVSLPGIDFMIVSGKEVAAPNFICPHCNKKANLSYKEPDVQDELIPGVGEVVVIKEGKIHKKKL